MDKEEWENAVAFHLPVGAVVGMFWVWLYGPMVYFIPGFFLYLAGAALGHGALASKLRKL